VPFRVEYLPGINIVEVGSQRLDTASHLSSSLFDIAEPVSIVLGFADIPNLRRFPLMFFFDRSLSEVERETIGSPELDTRLLRGLSDYFLEVAAIIPPDDPYGPGISLGERAIDSFCSKFSQCSRWLLSHRSSSVSMTTIVPSSWDVTDCQSWSS